MQRFKTDDWKFVSQGYNCYCKTYIANSLQILQPTEFFDFIGSPMWAVMQLIQNEFQDIKRGETVIEPVEVVPGTTVQTERGYNLRFRHDFTVQTKRLSRFEMDFVLSKYERRAKCFLKLLQEEKKIVFLRLEEKMEGRKVLSEENHLYYSTASEIEYLQQFSNFLSSIATSLRFQIIFLAYEDKEARRVDDHIVVIPIDSTIEYETCAKMIENEIESNSYIFNMDTKEEEGKEDTWEKEAVELEKE